MTKSKKYKRDRRDARLGIVSPLPPNSSDKKNNERFEYYYKAQASLFSEDDYKSFMTTLRSPIFISFRVAGNGSKAKELKKLLIEKFLPEVTGIKMGSRISNPPTCISWIPNEMAWQLDVTRSIFRKNGVFKFAYQFLDSERSNGTLNFRKDDMAAIPEILLDVKSHHKILDMYSEHCMHTQYLIEALHEDETKQDFPDGFIVTNCGNFKSCQALTTSMFQSPCHLGINENPQYIPDLYILNDEKEKEILKFDRILIDAPCSEDGLIQWKSDLWVDWDINLGYQFTYLQRNILMRGLTMLAVGGRLVYSTYSLNPVENEAVVCYALQMCKGAVELIDVSKEVTNLKYMGGVSTWKLATYGPKPEILSSYSDVPEPFKVVIEPNMFPPSEKELEALHLDRCIRVLPHHQGTSGFFAAVFHKVKEFSVKVDERGNNVFNECEATNLVSNLERRKRDMVKAACVASPIPKRRKIDTTKGKSILFLKEESLQNTEMGMYGINIPLVQLFYAWPVRNKYYNDNQLFCCNKNIANLMKSSSEMKVIYAGIQIFEKSKLLQNRVHFYDEMITKRKVMVPIEDMKTLLGGILIENYVSSNTFEYVLLSKESQNAISEIIADSGIGGALFVYGPDGKEGSPQCKLFLCPTLNPEDCHIEMKINQRIHYRRLCGLEFLPEERLLHPRKKDLTTETYDTENADGNISNDEKVENDDDDTAQGFWI